MKQVFFPAVILSFFALNCSEDSSSGPNGSIDTAYIRILEPKAGAKVRLNEEFKIVTESDYDRFGQKLTFSATTDSGKSWLGFIISLEPRTGMKVRDTVPCTLGDLGFKAGEKTKIKVIEYGKIHSATTDFIEILP